jgi:hypothetical protein
MIHFTTFEYYTCFEKDLYLDLYNSVDLYYWNVSLAAQVSTISESFFFKQFIETETNSLWYY